MQKTLLFGIACLGVVTLVFIDRWQVTHWRAEKEIELHAMAELYQTRLENVIASRLNAVQAISSLFVLHPETKSEEFTHFAAMLLKFNPPIRALQYADSKTRVTYVYPTERNEITITKPIILLTDPERGPFVEKAISQKTASVQGPFELRQGGTGLVVRSPIFLGESFIGLAIGVYDVPVLIQEALTGINLNQFAYRLVDSEGRLFSGSDNISGDFQERFISVADSQWTFSLNWKKDTVHPPVLTRVLIMVCGAGFLLSSLLLIYFLRAQTKRLQRIVEERTQDLSKSNKSLINEIFEREETEKSLRESEAHLRTLIDSLPDLVWLKDSEGVYLSCNSKFERFFGAKEADIIGKTDYDFLDKNLADFFRKNDKIAMTTVKPSMNEEQVTYADDGHTEYLETVKSPMFNYKGELIGVLGIARDITERKKLEAQLQQAQKMESIGTLAGGIAHDFNNILFPIVGHTEMLLDDVPEDSPLRASLNEIYTSALRAKGLVKQILTFSRQEGQELMLMKMQPIIKEAIKLIRATIPTIIEIKHDISPDCGVIKADPTQIHQIVMNLSTNAYHAMEETGGILKVSLKEIELGEHDLITPDMIPGIYACLIVADTGKGMDKNLTDKIFDPFFTTKAIGKGTGMGLSVVHGIVLGMNGSIQVNSQPGKGTQFNVYLPVQKTLSEKQVSISNAKVQGGTEQVLLVDDEEAILTMEKRILERLGYQVTTRASSIEALEAFRAHPDRFDLVITDMAMPNMPGDKLSVEITKIRPDIPVLLCTGFSETMSEEKATSLGIKGFLLKPIVMMDLAQKIRDVLDEN